MMDTDKIRDSLERLCVKRECCTQEITAKAAAMLRKAGCEDCAEESGKITSRLVQERFIDDARYASAFAREKSALTGWGPIKIRAALASKGIGQEDISAALGSIDGDRADGKLRKMLQSKWKTLEGEPAAKLKLLKFALSRGYGYDEVRDAVEDTVKGNI